MNCNPRNRRDYLELKIRAWLELALYGVDKRDRTRGRKNLRHLMRAYPEIAAQCAKQNGSL